MAHATNIEAVLERIAQREMDVPTLRERGWDQHDFHEVGVWALASALRSAYLAGFDHAASGGTRPSDEPVPETPPGAPIVPEGEHDAPRGVCARCGETNPERLRRNAMWGGVTCLSCGAHNVIHPI